MGLTQAIAQELFPGLPEVVWRLPNRGKIAERKATSDANLEIKELYLRLTFLSMVLFIDASGQWSEEPKYKKQTTEHIAHRKHQPISKEQVWWRHRVCYSAIFTGTEKVSIGDLTLKIQHPRACWLLLSSDLWCYLNLCVTGGSLSLSCYYLNFSLIGNVRRRSHSAEE